MTTRGLPTKSAKEHLRGGGGGKGYTPRVDVKSDLAHFGLKEKSPCRMCLRARGFITCVKITTIENQSHKPGL